MPARQSSVRGTGEQACVQRVRSRIALGLGQKKRGPPASGELADLRHPPIRLRLDPLDAEAIGKTITADHQFRRYDPLGAQICGLQSAREHEATVLHQSPRYWGHV